MKITEKPLKSAMALYVKLYCKRIKRTKNRQLDLKEATKSWVSLSKTDKQYFFDVFEEYETKVKKYVASNLQNAQLYMKKNSSYAKRSCKSKEVTVECNQHSQGNREIHKENSFLNCHNNDDNIEIQHHNEQSCKSKEVTVDCNQHFQGNREIHEENSFLNCHNNDDNIEIQHHNEQLENYSTTTIPDNVEWVNLESNVVKTDMPKYISEPTPPIRSSMELFEIIKNSEETTQNINWADLTKSQKQRYQRAVLRIKNNYLKQYTAYLEQLPPNKLFHYYKSKF